MRAPMLRLFIAAILLLLPTSSTILGQDYNPHGSGLADWDLDQHEHTAAKIWVNTKSGKYFYPGSRWYGKTKSGLHNQSELSRQSDGLVFSFCSLPKSRNPPSPLDSLGVEQEVSPWPTGAVQCKRQSKYMVDDGQPQAQLRQADLHLPGFDF